MGMRTTGSVSKHCQARARFSISRAEKLIPAEPLSDIVTAAAIVWSGELCSKKPERPGSRILQRGLVRSYPGTEREKKDAKVKRGGRLGIYLLLAESAMSRGNW